MDTPQINKKLEKLKKNEVSQKNDSLEIKESPSGVGVDSPAPDVQATEKEVVPENLSEDFMNQMDIPSRLEIPSMDDESAKLADATIANRSEDEALTSDIIQAKNVPQIKQEPVANADVPTLLEKSPDTDPMLEMTREELSRIRSDPNASASDKLKAKDLTMAYMAGEHPSQVGTSDESTSQDKEVAQRATQQNFTRLASAPLGSDFFTDMSGGAEIPTRVHQPSLASPAKEVSLTDMKEAMMKDARISQEQKDTFESWSPEKQAHALSLYSKANPLSTPVPSTVSPPVNAQEEALKESSQRRTALSKNPVVNVYNTIARNPKYSGERKNMIDYVNAQISATRKQLSSIDSRDPKYPVLSARYKEMNTPTGKRRVAMDWIASNKSAYNLK